MPTIGDSPRSIRSRFMSTKPCSGSLRLAQLAGNESGARTSSVAPQKSSSTMPDPGWSAVLQFAGGLGPLQLEGTNGVGRAPTATDGTALSIAVDVLTGAAK